MHISVTRAAVAVTGSILLTALAALAQHSLTGTALAAAQTYSHVFVIAEENHSLDQIVGSSSAPYINGTLIARGALATNYSGLSHPSLPNYLGLTSGSIWNNPQDTTPQDMTYAGPSVVDGLATANVSWKAYMEDMPSACDLTDTFGPGGYDVNHNPFMYFSEIRDTPAQCNRDVPFTQLATDLGSAATTPSFAFISPNLTDDMHNGTIAQGDTWLSQHVPAIQSSPACTGSTCLIVVTWDEGATTELVATIFIGDGVPAGFRSSVAYTHYSLLRTIEDNFGVAPMTARDQAAFPMTDMLGTSSPSPATQLACPAVATPAAGQKISCTYKLPGADIAVRR